LKGRLPLEIKDDTGVFYAIDIGLGNVGTALSFSPLL